MPRPLRGFQAGFLESVCNLSERDNGPSPSDDREIPRPSRNAVRPLKLLWEASLNIPAPAKPGAAESLLAIDKSQFRGNFV